MGKTELRKRGADPNRLTDKQRRFCQEYPKDFNGTRAAIAAGYSKRAAAVTAAKLLKNPIVQAYLGKLQRLDAERLELDRQLVLKKLVEALTYEARDFCDENGLPLHPNELPQRVQSQVDGIDWDITETVDDEGNTERHMKVRYRMTPRATAREQAMKHKGLFAPDRMDIRSVRFDFDKLCEDQSQTVDSLEQAIEAEPTEFLLEDKSDAP